MSALLFLLQSLWTCHQEFGAYGSMRRQLDIYMKNQLFGSFSKKKLTMYKVKF